jgi:hypothetical protein
MKSRHWVAVGSFTAAFIIGLSALLSPSAQFVGDPSIGTLDGNGKGKGPKCGREVFCLPQNCEQIYCPNSNPCKCYCVPIPNCEPLP